MTEQETELRELDAWIAEHLFGWKWYRCEYHGQSYCPESGRTRFNFLPSPHTGDWTCVEADISQAPPDQITEKWTPRYSTDRAASQEVLERCLSKKLIGDTVISNDGDYWLRVSVGHGDVVEVSAPTLPLAICKFAQKLFAKKLFGKE